jgi:hypothetical protein
VVECRPEVKETVPHDDAEARRYGSDALDTEPTSLDQFGDSLRRGLRVRLIDSLIGFSLDPRFGLRIESLEMFMRPI